MHLTTRLDRYASRWMRQWASWGIHRRRLVLEPASSVAYRDERSKRTSCETPVSKAWNLSWGRFVLVNSGVGRGGEDRYHPGELFRGPIAPQRYLHLDPPPNLLDRNASGLRVPLVHRLRTRGGDAAGTYGVYEDAVRGELDGRAPREAGYRRAESAGENEVLDGLLDGRGRDVDDAPAAALAHQGERPAHPRG